MEREGSEETQWRNRNCSFIPPRARDGVGHRITPDSAGWRYVGFETRTLKQGREVEARHRRRRGLRRDPLGQGAGDRGRLRFRRHWRARSVFDGLPWSVYLPPRSAATIEAATDCELALCSAPASGASRRA